MAMLECAGAYSHLRSYVRDGLGKKQYKVGVSLRTPTSPCSVLQAKHPGAGDDSLPCGRWRCWSVLRLPPTDALRKKGSSFQRAARYSARSTSLCSFRVRRRGEGEEHVIDIKAIRELQPADRRQQIFILYAAFPRIAVKQLLQRQA